MPLPFCEFCHIPILQKCVVATRAAADARNMGAWEVITRDGTKQWGVTYSAMDKLPGEKAGENIAETEHSTSQSRERYAPRSGDARSIGAPLLIFI